MILSFQRHVGGSIAYADTTGSSSTNIGTSRRGGASQVRFKLKKSLVTASTAAFGYKAPRGLMTDVIGYANKPGKAEALAALLTDVSLRAYRTARAGQPSGFCCPPWAEIPGLAP